MYRLTLGGFFMIMLAGLALWHQTDLVSANASVGGTYNRDKCGGQHTRES